ncbi:MAG TPA: RelA/SpoT domain-containing protein [Sphingopyxis sp.]|mgnify:CR=1 FL=1|nr:RelA/SpoT domain-containing protein [Sphingopyxis sp.]HMP45595.1 RelA/SpoT domain-containing protein [Sphingopyxis sp.]HMQ17935.1 RelA/SpoT domain-containing protein [Sphingopyxis sp.]
MSLERQYKDLYSEVLVETSKRLREYIAEIFADIERVDAITARAKAPDRFFVKASKLTSDGKPKYTDPINEIQDQIGARITVFYLPDVKNARKIIERYFNYIEFQSKYPENNSEFGYFGEHMILKLPDDIIKDNQADRCPEFFELQIKTLFQHAWSEAHHDLGYKAPRPLTPLEERQVAFSAAQAWGADQIFDQLRKSVLSSLVSGDGEAPKADGTP